jgi:hypothetical protein
MTVEIIKCIEIVPKRHAFKARSYNSAELKNWVDFGSVRKDFSYSLLSELQIKSFGLHCDDFVNTLYAIYTITTNAIIPTIFFINYSPNLILQAVFTQPENDSPSFLACWLICSSKSSSKRRFFLVLFERSYLFFSFFSCIGYLTSIPRDCNSFRITLFIQPASDSSPSSFCAFSMARRNSGSSLNWNGGLPRLFSDMCIDTSITLVVMYLCVMTCYYHILKKAIPRNAGTLPRDLTTITLNEVMIMANRYDNARLRAKQSKIYKSSKKHLHNLNNSGYIDNALAKSKDRIGTLNSYLATHDAQCVFFCVNACAHLYNRFSSMVALVGQPKGWLGHRVTSSSNPANVTAKEIGTSCGDYVNNYSEAVAMTTIPTTVISNQKLFKFYDLTTAKVFEALAPTEQQARKSLGKSSLIFIARIRLYPMVKNSINFGRV